MRLWILLLIVSSVLCQQARSSAVVSNAEEPTGAAIISRTEDAVVPHAEQATEETTASAAAVPPLPPTPTADDHASMVLPLSAISEPPRRDVDSGSKCWAVWRHMCPPLTDTCRCRPVDNQSAVCCDIYKSFQLTEGLGCESVKNLSITRLHLWNVTLPDLDSLSKRGLSSITVSQSHLRRMRLSGPTSCLNISGNLIDDLSANAFTHLKNLQFLSLAYLNLTHLPHFKTNVTLDLKGNLTLDCRVLLKYLTDYPNTQFANANETFCFTLKRIGWFNTTEGLMLSQLRILRDVEVDCVAGCHCTVDNMNIVPGVPNHYYIIVNCSSMGLTALPAIFPPNARTLDVSNNSISSLEPLIHDQAYQNIEVFLADSNHILSISPLEGSLFISKFQVLNLRNNRINSLPTYIFNSAFDRVTSTRVFLGGNKLFCNCSVAQNVKLWLTANRKYIYDYDQIDCSNLLEKVIDLDPNKLCIYERDWTDYIYFIIAGEVTLLVLLVGKVSYDYWVFKTAGYLPWPASKMPKLPCDWVFE